MINFVWILRPVQWILFSVAQVPAQQKLLKKNVQGEPGRRLEQVLSTILACVLLSFFKKTIAQPIAHQKNSWTT